MAKTSRSYDFVLFGGTGFTGGLTAEYLARHAPDHARWALAGRNPAKLAALRQRLAAINPACAAIALLTVDASNATELADLAARSKVVISTVGPYILHGLPLVAACAAAGTHYCDLTGEPEFVDQVWMHHHAIAQANGAKLVHSCGFDSIPHDLGAYYTIKQLPAGDKTVEGFVSAGGKFSGGTFHSALTAFSRARSYVPLALERRRMEQPPAQRSVGSTLPRISYSRRLRTWVLPMPTIDPLVVMRSAAALPEYGARFRYGHFIQVPKLYQAAALVGGVSALFVGAQFSLSRNWLLGRKSAGDGPTLAQREKGWFRVRFYGEGSGKKVTVDVKGGDPGYGETAKMLAESGLSLAYDLLPARAGQLTPATAMGDALLARLQAAGITFTVAAQS